MTPFGAKNEDELTEHGICLSDERRDEERVPFHMDKSVCSMTAIMATLYCTFCGKSQHEVKVLIAGPTVFICDACIELCVEIARELRGTVSGENEYLSWFGATPNQRMDILRAIWRRHRYLWWKSGPCP